MILMYGDIVIVGVVEMFEIGVFLGVLMFELYVQVVCVVVWDVGFIFVDIDGIVIVGLMVMEVLYWLGIILCWFDGMMVGGGSFMLLVWYVVVVIVFGVVIMVFIMYGELGCLQVGVFCWFFLLLLFMGQYEYFYGVVVLYLMFMVLVFGFLYQCGMGFDVFVEVVVVQCCWVVDNL